MYSVYYAYLLKLTIVTLNELCIYIYILVATHCSQDHMASYQLYKLCHTSNVANSPSYANYLSILAPTVQIGACNDKIANYNNNQLAMQLQNSTIQLTS